MSETSMVRIRLVRQLERQKPEGSNLWFSQKVKVLFFAVRKFYYFCHFSLRFSTLGPCQGVQVG